MSYLASSPALCSVIAGASTPETVQADAAAAGWRSEPAEREVVAALA